MKGRKAAVRIFIFVLFIKMLRSKRKLSTCEK